MSDKDIDEAVYELLLAMANAEGKSHHDILKKALLDANRAGRKERDKK